MVVVLGCSVVTSDPSGNAASVGASSNVGTVLFSVNSELSESELETSVTAVY